MKKFNLQRVKIDRGVEIIKSTINDLNLDLTGKVVLTELGSNDFLFTPIIPILANANKVFATVRDSKYGRAVDISKDFKKKFKQIDGIDRIEIYCNELPLHLIKDADIITNSNPLRPLDIEKLSLAKKNAVIPLMYESWELREGEIDIDYCRKNNIKVGGTWENHPSLRVFDYISILGLKLALDAGFEVMGNSVYVWSNDHFGEVISKSLKKNGATVYQGVDLNQFYEKLPDLDFIFLCHYNESMPFFSGQSPIFSLQRIKSINSKLGIIHLYGMVDFELLEDLGFYVYPRKIGYPKYMTETLSYCGQIPVLRLLVGGFKVGQELLEKKYSSITQLIV